MLGGQGEAGLEGSVRGDDEIDRSVGGDGAGPLDVEIGFDGGKVGAVGIVDTVDAGVIAVDDDLGRIGGQAEQGAELIYKIDVDVGFVDDGDGLAIAPEGGGQVVLDGEIGGREDEVGAGVIKA